MTSFPKADILGPKGTSLTSLWGRLRDGLLAEEALAKSDTALIDCLLALWKREGRREEPRRGKDGPEEAGPPTDGGGTRKADTREAEEALTLALAALALRKRQGSLCIPLRAEALRAEFELLFQAAGFPTASALSPASAVTAPQASALPPESAHPAPQASAAFPEASPAFPETPAPAAWAGVFLRHLEAETFAFLLASDGGSDDGAGATNHAGTDSDRGPGAGLDSGPDRGLGTGSGSGPDRGTRAGYGPGGETPFKPLVRSRGLLYFQKDLAAEKKLAEALRRRLEAPPLPFPPSFDPGAWKRALEEGTAGGSSAPTGMGGTLRLDPSQAEAVLAAATRPFFILCGGPGTGKTTIVAEMLRLLLHLQAIRPERVALAAPTGRAAARLTEANPGLPAAQTLHRLLGYNPSTQGYRHHAHHPIPADLVVVDEASMVDTALFSRLLSALEPETRLLLLGDADQLPSVEAGSVLSDLARRHARPPDRERPDPGPVFFLTRSHRANPSLLRLAEAVRKGEGREALRFLSDSDPGSPLPAGPGCFLRRPAAGTGDAPRLPASDLGALLEAWADRHLGEAFLVREARRLSEAVAGPLPGPAASPLPGNALEPLFEGLRKSRVLTPLRQGPFGVQGLNAFLMRHLRRRFDPESQPVAPASASFLGPGGYFAGLPVLILENQPALQLHNGDLGLVLGKPGHYRVFFPRKGGGHVSHAPEALPPHESAFAGTVHKSQGSEYGKVLLVLPPEDHPLLTREILYTAITRAKESVLLFARPDLLVAALARGVERASGLLGRLEGRGEP